MRFSAENSAAEDVRKQVGIEEYARRAPEASFDRSAASENLIRRGQIN
jgi:hypothetical protein